MQSSEMRICENQGLRSKKGCKQSDDEDDVSNRSLEDANGASAFTV